MYYAFSLYHMPVKYFGIHFDNAILELFEAAILTQVCFSSFITVWTEFWNKTIFCCTCICIAIHQRVVEFSTNEDQKRKTSYLNIDEQSLGLFFTLKYYPNISVTFLSH